jgi:hypothetical protein
MRENVAVPMKKLILVLAAAAAMIPNATVLASTTSLRASPSSSLVGQKVTFTATFASSCPGSLTTHYFTIDGKVYNGTLAQSGQAGSETLSMSSLAVGTHGVTYYWKINGTICRGTASMSYSVAPQPSPSPSPLPSPSPTPSPTPSPSTLVALRTDDTQLLGYLGGALIVLTVLSGIALAVLGRR